MPLIWLVVDLPLWKICSSVGMIIPNIWKNKIHVPNHQPVIAKHSLLKMTHFHVPWLSYPNAFVDFSLPSSMTAAQASHETADSCCIFLICSAALYSLRQHASMVTSWMVTSSCGHPWWESLRVCGSIYILYIYNMDSWPSQGFLGAQHFITFHPIVDGPAKSCTNRMVFRPMNTGMFTINWCRISLAHPQYSICHGHTPMLSWYPLTKWDASWQKPPLCLLMPAPLSKSTTWDTQ